MISCQEIVNRCNFLLDAEGSDRYTWDRDFKPAINSAIEWLESLFNAGFAKKKFTPEGLRELTKVRVFKASKYSRLSFDSTSVGDYLWTIIAIYPEIEYIGSAATIPADQDYAQFCDSLSFFRSNYSCNRVTMQEWNKRNINPFVAGSSLITCDDLKQYAYVEFGNYTGGYTVVGDAWEVEISPDVANGLVALAYLKIPDNVTAIGDNIEFPQVLTDFVVQKVLNFITFKEGEQTLKINTTQELNQLTNLMAV